MKVLTTFIQLHLFSYQEYVAEREPLPSGQNEDPECLRDKHNFGVVVI